MLEAKVPYIYPLKNQNLWVNIYPMLYKFILYNHHFPQYPYFHFEIYHHKRNGRIHPITDNFEKVQNQMNPQYI